MPSCYDFQIFVFKGYMHDDLYGVKSWSYYPVAFVINWALIFVADVIPPRMVSRLALNNQSYPGFESRDINR